MKLLLLLVLHPSTSRRRQAVSRLHAPCRSKHKAEGRGNLHKIADFEGDLTPMHCTALGNTSECAQLLLDAGAYRSAADGTGHARSCSFRAFLKG